MNPMFAPPTSIHPRHAIGARHAVEAPFCTTPGSFGEKAQNRSSGDGSCYFLDYNRATRNPRLALVQDPFGNLLAKATGSVLVSSKDVAEASEEGV